MHCTCKQVQMTFILKQEYPMHCTCKQVQMTLNSFIPFPRYANIITIKEYGIPLST